MLRQTPAFLKSPCEVIMRYSFGSVVVLAVVAAACGSEHADVRASTTDSAGINVITMRGGAGADTLVPTRVWHVGGDDAPLLDVNDLAMTASGLVLVANNGNNTVVAFDRDGAERWRFGRHGSGPGEFEGSLNLATVGDTTFAFEFANRRLTAIAPGGSLLRIVQIGAEEPNLELVGGFPGGSLLFTSRHLFGPEPGINHDSVVYLRLHVDGVRAGTVGWGRRRNVEFFLGKLGPNIQNEAFGAVGDVTVHRDGVAQIDGKSPEVMIRNAEGVVTRLIRWPAQPLSITSTDRAEFQQEQLESAADEYRRRQAEEWLGKATWPATMPMISRVLSRGQSQLLVAAHCLARASQCIWIGFNERGERSGTWRLPVHATDAVASGDLLITLSTDGNGLGRLDAWHL